MSSSVVSLQSARGRGPQASRSREVLTFRLGREEYGIDILRVQEIRGYEEPVRIANAPAHVKGVVNLRGVIVPIVDLRLKFGLDAPSYDQFTVVVILNVAQRVVGAVVDSVSDVLDVTDEQIRPAPAMEAAVDASYITGIATLAERMLVLVDIERLLGVSTLQSLDYATGVAA